MDKVTSCEQAIQIVKDIWTITEPPWEHFECHRQGPVWIVNYDKIFIDGIERWTVRINAKTGRITTLKQ